MNTPTDMTPFSFYGSDFDPEDNDHMQEDIPLPGLDDAVKYARDLLPGWGCQEVDVVVDNMLLAIVTTDGVLAGQELAEHMQAQEDDVWEVSFFGSNYEPGNDKYTETMELPAWDAVIAQAQKLLDQWGAEYVDVRGEDCLVARVTHEGTFLPEGGEDDEDSFYPEYDFYASDCDLTDPSNDRMEMGLIFDDLDNAVEYARELMSGWGCEYVDIHADEELIARVSSDGTITSGEAFEADKA